MLGIFGCYMTVHLSAMCPAAMGNCMKTACAYELQGAILDPSSVGAGSSSGLLAVLACVQSETGDTTGFGSQTSPVACTVDYNDDCMLSDTGVTICGAGGTCYDKGVNSFECSCNAMYAGAPGPCYATDCKADPSPCGSTSRCVQEAGVVGVSCTCMYGWEGDACDEDVNECDSAPCNTGSTCTHGVDAFHCNCASGWMGDTCQHTALAPDCSGTPCDVNAPDHKCATVDDCGFCSGGTTGLERGASCRDCAGTKVHICSPQLLIRYSRHGRPDRRHAGSGSYTTFRIGLNPLPLLL
jgi:hypothetical protein